ncbi:MAG: hypothetical protein EON60_09665 [Alphaproteobacteria bacterium]|nr:MAG: hypothetical protein EON60_09665 [Alphaproteobacteria bacterium]
MQKQEEWNGDVLAGANNCLVKILHVDDGQSFAARLAALNKRGDVPERFSGMIQTLLRGYGDNPSLIGRGDFSPFMVMINKGPLRGKRLDVGKKPCRKLYIAAMLSMLSVGEPLWEPFKTAWNEKAQRHSKLV